MADLYSVARHAVHLGMLQARRASMLALHSVTSALARKYLSGWVTLIVSVTIMLTSGFRLYEILGSPPVPQPALSVGFGVNSGSYSGICEKELTIRVNEEPQFPTLNTAVITTLKLAIVPRQNNSSCNVKFFDFALEGIAYESANLSFPSSSSSQPVRGFLSEDRPYEEVRRGRIMFLDEYADPKRHLYVFRVEGYHSVEVTVQDVNLAWGIMQRRIDIIPFVYAENSEYGYSLYSTLIRIETPSTDFIKDFSRRSLNRTAITQYRF